MDRFTRVLAGLLGRSAGLLPAARRDWAEAVLAEAGEIPAGAEPGGVAGRRAVAGGAGGLDGRVIRVLAFAVAAASLVWSAGRARSSNSAVPLNRMYVVGHRGAAGRAAGGWSAATSGRFAPAGRRARRG